MIWLGPVILGAATLAVLLRARMPALWLVPILVAAVAAYAVAGHPTQPSREHRSEPPSAEMSDVLTRASDALGENPADIQQWGALSSALIADGRTEEAVRGLTLAARNLPPNADLQVLLGTALMAHADGVVTPAARLAFGRASAMQPDHPAPPYFLGLAYLQAGDPQDALGVWQTLMARTPPGAPWRSDLESKIRAARMMMSAGVGAAPDAN